MLRGRELVEHVAHKRIEMIAKEVEPCFPGAGTTMEMLADGRAHIAIEWEGVPIGEEYVETATSWNQPERLVEYRKALVSNRKRLVVLVPERHARSARLKMLELNHWWLFYYLVFSYDHQGNIRKVGRPTYCFPDSGYS
ncbi:MAG: hypothetical protein LUQ39_08375 [Methanomassiliicoccales archaeon]|nr:hypothetical protein [Methanomassiliicoccales archaeon]